MVNKYLPNGALFGQSNQASDHLKRLKSPLFKPCSVYHTRINLFRWWPAYSLHILHLSAARNIMSWLCYFSWVAAAKKHVYTTVAVYFFLSQLNPLRSGQEQEGLHSRRLAAVFRNKSKSGQLTDQEVSGDPVACRWSPGCHSFCSEITKGLYR